jgi:hypothetical protein
LEGIAIIGLDRSGARGFAMEKEVSAFCRPEAGLQNPKGGRTTPAPDRASRPGQS